MGLFSRKNKEYQMLDISGDILFFLLEEAKKECITKVNNDCYFSGPEIMFTYNDKIHFIGIKYDKKEAKNEDYKNFANLWFLFISTKHRGII